MIFLAVILTALVGNALSASIVHKEIELNHNGVHYKIAVDAEKDNTIQHLGDSDIEHQDEIGKIGFHYEVPHAGHLPHENEDEEHHGAVVHIELGDDLEVQHQHEDEEDHQVLKQHEVHQDAKRQSLDYSKHYDQPELGYQTTGHLNLQQEPIYHGWKHHNMDYDNLQQYVYHPTIGPVLIPTVHHDLGGQDDLSLYSLGGHHVGQDLEHQGSHKWMNYGLSHQYGQLYDPSQYQLDQSIHTVPHYGKPHMLGEDKKSFWVHPMTIGPNQIHSVPFVEDVENNIGHEGGHQYQWSGLKVIHPIHPGLHH